MGRKLWSIGQQALDKCPYCGAETRPGDNFCLNCGNRLLSATPSERQNNMIDQPQPPLRPPPQHSRRIRTLFFGIIVPLLFCCLCFFIVGLGGVGLQEGVLALTHTKRISVGGVNNNPLTGIESEATNLAWAPDGKRIASTRTQGSTAIVEIWDAATGNRLLSYQGHAAHTFNAVTWSPDGQRLASAFYEDQPGVPVIKIWDATTGKTLLNHRVTEELGGDEPAAVKWSPDGARIASVVGSTVAVWNATSGQTDWQQQGSSYTVTVAWSPDSRRLVSDWGDHTLEVWDARTGSPLLTYHGHSGEVDAVAWSPDGKTIASAGEDDGLVQVWDAATGKTRLSYRGQYVRRPIGRHGLGKPFPITSVSWSPDGRYLASVQDSVKIWDARTGKDLTTYAGSFFNGVNDASVAAWSPDGKTIAMLFDGKWILIWQVPPNLSSPHVEEKQPHAARPSLPQ
jgi:WD40 repeat protein